MDDAGDFAFPDKFGHNTFSAELHDIEIVLDALLAGSLESPPPRSGCSVIRGVVEWRFSARRAIRN